MARRIYAGSQNGCIVQPTRLSAHSRDWPWQPWRRNSIQGYLRSSPATAATFASVAVPRWIDTGMRRNCRRALWRASERLASSFRECHVDSVRHHHRTIHSKIIYAGILPGLLTASFLSWLSMVVQINPSIGPKGERSSWNERLKSLPEVLLVVAIFLVLVGGLMNASSRPPRLVASDHGRTLLSSQEGYQFQGYIRSLLES